MSRKLKIVEPTPRAPGRAEQAIPLLLKCLQHSLRQSFDEALRRNGVVMSFAQVASLFGLYHQPGSTGAQLARRAAVSAQSMSAALHRLELDRLVERRPHPESRRADSWFLTEEGARRFAHARAVGDPVLARMLAPLSQREVEQLEDYLSRCLDALGDATGLLPGTDKGAGSSPSGKRRETG